jgi:hypothetical protein
MLKMGVGVAPKCQLIFVGLDGAVSQEIFLFGLLSMAIQPFGPWPLFQFLNPIYNR